MEKCSRICVSNDDDHDGDDSGSDSEAEYEEDEFGDNVSEDMEQYELRCENVLQVVHPGDIIACFPQVTHWNYFICVRCWKLEWLKLSLQIPSTSRFTIMKTKQIVNSVKTDRSSSLCLKLLHTFCLPK